MKLLEKFCKISKIPYDKKIFLWNLNTLIFDTLAKVFFLCLALIAGNIVYSAFVKQLEKERHIAEMRKSYSPEPDSLHKRFVDLNNPLPDQLPAK